MKDKINKLINYAMDIDVELAMDIKNAAKESFYDKDSKIYKEFIMIDSEEMQGMVDEGKVEPDYEIKSFIFEK